MSGMLSPPYEAYLDVTENLQGIPLARDIAPRFREKIKAETGLNASAGISYNNFLAKLASDHRKPNGQFVISPEMGPAFVEALPVGKFHGIGPPTSAKMNQLGIFTGLDMRKRTLEFMNANFGKAGANYYWIARGVDEHRAEAGWPDLVFGGLLCDVAPHCWLCRPHSQGRASSGPAGRAGDRSDAQR
jgi:DNA polymerase IV